MDEVAKAREAVLWAFDRRAAAWGRLREIESGVILRSKADEDATRRTAEATADELSIALDALVRASMERGAEMMREAAAVKVRDHERWSVLPLLTAKVRAIPVATIIDQSRSAAGGE